MSAQYIVRVSIAVLIISRTRWRACVCVCNYMYVRKALLDSLSFRKNKHSKSGTPEVTENFTQKKKFCFILITIPLQLK